MEQFWAVLGLEPTQDISAIRQAYARRARECHPEEDPEGFLALRQAYQAALDYAEGNSAPPPARPREEEPEGWSVPDELPEVGENPFRDGEAIRQFEALYTGKQRKNPKLWMDYVTSDAFLDAAWDRRFTALLLEKVTEVERELPPGREFIQWLYTAYQLGVHWTEDTAPDGSRQRIPQLHISREGQFDGQESIFKIALKGPIPKPPRGNELAVRNSFLDYRHLVGLAERGAWDEQAMEEFKWVMDRYASAYIKERCEQRTSPDTERHPAGLRVFIHFFQRPGLPEELYRMVWNRFDLKSAVMGRGKVLYGRLRELAVEHVPGIDGEKPENFFQLNQERDACYSRIKARPESEEAEADALFARESMQRALRSQRFMQEQLQSHFNWLNWTAPEGIVRRIAEFYRSHPELPGWDRVLDRAEQELESRAEIHQRQEAERRRLEADVSPGDLDLSLLAQAPERVYVQPLAGPERLYRPEGRRDTEGKTDDDEAWTDLPEERELEKGEPLSQEGLIELIARFTQGELARLEVYFYSGVLVLTHSGEGYACFYFEYSYDTWYTMLSQPEVYQTVDYKEVVYRPFGMGKLASYNIHESAGSILRNLNLAFMQIGRGRPQVRAGDSWLWSTDTYQQNGSHKKRMAMQKLAGIPAWRASGYILGKFVLSQYPAEVERVTMEGERFRTVLQPGRYGLAADSLVRFVQRKLAKLRLTWTFQRPEGGAYQRHIVLLQDGGGAFVMLWLRDDLERAELYTSDEPRAFRGKVYPACPVHLDLVRIRNCLDLMLDDMTCADLITDRPGQFVPADRPYEQLRAELVDET